MVSGNAQKTAFGRTLNQAAEKKVRDAIQLLGKGLPCSVVSVEGWIVEVKFELDTDFTLPNVTVPVASSKYDYLPLEEGSPGVVRPADARLGGLSGLGGGTAKLALAANLSTLVFSPFGNKEWEPPEDPKMRVVQGPNGVIVRDLEGRAIVTVDGDGKTITAKIGDDVSVTLTEDDVVAKVGDDAAITVNADGAEMSFGDDVFVNVTTDGVEIKGELTINGHKYLDHKHSGVQTGGSNSGVVVP